MGHSALAFSVPTAPLSTAVMLWASHKIIPLPAFHVYCSTSRSFDSTDAVSWGLIVWGSQQEQLRPSAIGWDKLLPQLCEGRWQVFVRDSASVTVTAHTPGLPLYVIHSIHTGKWMNTMDVYNDHLMREVTC